MQPQQNGHINGYANGHVNGHATDYNNGLYDPEEPQTQSSAAPVEQGPALEPGMTYAVTELLQALRAAMSPKESQQGADDPALNPVTIERQGQLIYADSVLEQPFVNELSLANVDHLQALLKQPPGSRIGGPEEQVVISVAGQPIFQVDQGIVTVNQLPPQQQSAPQLEHSPIYGGPGVTAVPAPWMVHHSMSLEQKPEQSESLLERLDQANEASQMTVGREPWMKQSLSERVHQKTTGLFSFVRKNRIADTAIDLLQQRGKLQQGEFVYDAEQYRLRGLGRHVLVEDLEGRGLMTIKTRLLGPPKISHYRLGPDQEADFLKVRTQLQERGIRGFSQDPIVRSKQMGGLAPQGDAKITADLKAFSVSDVARDLIKASGSRPDSQGKRVLDGQQYRIEEGSNHLTITAKGRGQVFSQIGGKITSNLTDQDTKHFIFVAKELAVLQKQRQHGQSQRQPQALKMR